MVGLKCSAALVACLVLILGTQGSDGQCEVGEKKYDVGEVWQEDSPECVKHTCMKDGTYDTTKCDPAEPSEQPQIIRNLSPPCCKTYEPPVPFRNIPRPNKFREGKCKEGNSTYQIGDVWNYDPECVEHVCLKNGSVKINRCPPVPKDIPEGWTLQAESKDGVFPFCCVKALPPPNPEEPGCTVDNKTVKLHEQYDLPGRCYYHVCTGVNEWAITACGILGSWHAWEIIPGDTSKPYPDCCGQPVPILDLVPDVLDELKSADILPITYGENVVDYGNELAPVQVKNQPTVTPVASPTDWYLLCMTDPDVPSRQDPTSREFLHWLVGNIPGSDVTSGDILAEYIGASPSKGTGLHRYVFILYKQPGKLGFHENFSLLESRVKFSTRKFAKIYGLGEPLAFNVFQAQWDDYVPELYEKLGFKVGKEIDKLV